MRTCLGAKISIIKTMNLKIQTFFTHKKNSPENFPLICLKNRKKENVPKYFLPGKLFHTRPRNSSENVFFRQFHNSEAFFFKDFPEKKNYLTNFLDSFFNFLQVFLFNVSNQVKKI